jgi:hypothetical protein
VVERPRIHVDLEGDPGGLFRPAESLVMRNARRQSEDDFATLKKMVEAGSGSGAVADTSPTHVP